MAPLLGAVADDFTGATDVAVAFRGTGLLTAIHFGLPRPGALAGGYDAVVVALKTRTIAPAAAVEQSHAAAEGLREAGADQLYVKYCSTFDSRPEGNIGPVLDDLADLLGVDHVVVCPSSPGHDRTVYEGRLFVAGVPLDESPMRDHPLTPMRDSSLVRLLRPQTKYAVDLVRHEVVRQGETAVRAALQALGEGRPRMVVVDAIDADDLAVIAGAEAEHPLLSGAAGLGEALARTRAARIGASADVPEAVTRGPAGRAAVLAGSCSARTVEQVDLMRAAAPSHFLDAMATPDSRRLAESALAFVDALPPDRSPLIYSTVPPEQLRAVQHALGRDVAAELVEEAMGMIALGLVDRGFQRLVVAGGETSGAVVTALQIGLASVGAEVAPGVCWVEPTDLEHVALLLKSGNFGGPGLLLDAAAELRPSESGAR